MSRNSEPLFACRDLRVRLADKEIVKGVSLTIRPGEVQMNGFSWIQIALSTALGNPCHSGACCETSRMQPIRCLT